MIGHLKGKLIYSNENSIILDVNGVGYEVEVPKLYTQKDINKNLELFIHTYIREDALDLYGFETAEEKKLFKTLLSVSRVGPSAAMNVLSSLAYERFINAILSENVSVLKEVSGIGPKTAQRLILELKSKIEDMLPELQIEKGQSMKKYDEELYEEGLKVRTVPTRRNGPEMVNPRIKSLNYLNNIMARIEANLQGAPEAIMLNQQGFVAECTGDNIFILNDQELLTPPRHAGILKGIKRGVALEIAEEMNLEIREELFTRYDLYNADECFLTGTAAEVIPVVEVGGRKIDEGTPGDYTAKIISRFREIANSSGVPIYQ